MTITSLLLALVAATVWMIERLAFAILLYMAFSAVWSFVTTRCAPLRRWVLKATLFKENLQRRYALWLLRHQLASGATP